MKSSKKLLLISFVVLAVLLLTFVLVLPHEHRVSRTKKNTSVLAIGNSTTIFHQIVDGLEDRGVNVTLLNDVPNSTEGLDKDEAVIFDGEWIENNAMSSKFHDFLRDAVPKGFKLAATGGLTSKFFEVLKDAGVMEFPEDRNPGYSNPPVVGYRVMEKYGSVGDSIYLGFGDDMNSIIESLLQWI